MKWKEITVKVKIFDDPEYCGECEYLGQERFVFSCELFTESGLLEQNYETDQAIKCPQCKAAFNDDKTPKKQVD